MSPSIDSPWFSATQVDTYDLCARKWAYKKIDGLEAPPKPSVVLGLETHGELEAWLREGRALNLTTLPGQIALSGIHHLPAPGTPGLEVETEFGLELGGHRFRGFKDFQILTTDPPLVGDHKTTTDFRWAKSADDLRGNTQAALYAADAMFRTGAESCDLLWIYYRTTGSRASQRVHLRVTRDEITPTLENVVRSAGEMTVLLRSGLTAKEIPPNPNACEAFGGCEFQGLCNLTEQERFKAIMTQVSKADFLAKLQQRNGSAINPPALASAPPTPILVNGRWVLPGEVAEAPAPEPIPEPTPEPSPLAASVEAPIVNAPAPAKRGRKPAPPVTVPAAVVVAPPVSVPAAVVVAPPVPEDAPINLAPTPRGHAVSILEEAAMFLEQGARLIRAAAKVA